MKANILIVFVAACFFLAAGIHLTFFTSQAHRAYSRMFRNGIENTGILLSWLDKYPGNWFIRLFGIICLSASVALLVVTVRRLVE